MSNVPQIYKVFVFLAVMGLAYLSYRMFMGFYVEWEYTFVTNEVSFAKITNKSKRKDIITCQVKDTLLIAKNTDTEHLGNLKKKKKKYHFLSNTTNEYYVWVLQEGTKKICIYFEPDETMLDSIRTLVRSKVYI